MMHKLEQFLNDTEVNYKKDVYLSSITKMSGTAFTSYLVKPREIEVLTEILKFAICGNLHFDVIGHWSNTYFKNSYHSDMVILTGGLKKKQLIGTSIVCETGVKLSVLARELSRKGIAGYEGLAGVPGTVGAAAINNSGSGGSVMQDLVESVTILQPDLKVVEIDRQLLNYSDRSSALKSGQIKGYVLSVKLRGDIKGDIEEMKQRMDSFNSYRLNYIDGKRKSLGSVFVSSGYSALHRRFRFRFLFLRVLLGPLKYFTKYTAKVNKLRTYLTFFLLGYPELAKHCDFVGRFCWDKDTTEDNFNSYLTKMDRLSGGQLKLEIQIKE